MTINWKVSFQKETVGIVELERVNNMIDSTRRERPYVDQND